MSVQNDVLNAFWCCFLAEDAVYIRFEDQREEYIQNDSGLLFIGTTKNIVSRPWSFDQVINNNNKTYPLIRTFANIRSEKKVNQHLVCDSTLWLCLIVL